VRSASQRLRPRWSTGNRLATAFRTADARPGNRRRAVAGRRAERPSSAPRSSSPHGRKTSVQWNLNVPASACTAAGSPSRARRGKGAAITRDDRLAGGCEGRGAVSGGGGDDCARIAMMRDWTQSISLAVALFPSHCDMTRKLLLRNLNSLKYLAKELCIRFFLPRDMQPEHFGQASHLRESFLCFQRRLAGLSVRMKIFADLSPFMPSTSLLLRALQSKNFQ